MEFLRSFLRRDLAGKPVVASPNVGCFLRLPQTRKLELHTEQIVPCESTAEENSFFCCFKSNHWFIVPFAVGRLNCRIPYEL